MKRFFWLFSIIILLLPILIWAQSPVLVMNPVGLKPHTTVYVIFDGSQPVIVTNFDYLINSQLALSRSTQTDVVIDILNDIYSRQADSTTHTVTAFQGAAPWYAVVLSSQYDVTNSILNNIYDRQSDSSTHNVTAFQGAAPWYAVILSSQSDVTNAFLSDIYDRLGSSDTHKVTSFQGAAPWIMIGTTTITNFIEITDALLGVARSTDIAKLNADILSALFGVSRSTDIAQLISALNTYFNNLMADNYKLAQSTNIKELNDNITGLRGDNYGLTRATQTDETNSKLNDIYDRQADSSTHQVTAHQGGTWTTGRTWQLDNQSDNVRASIDGSSNTVIAKNGWGINDSSGTGGLITGVTTAVITISENIEDIYFFMENSNDSSVYATITSNIRGPLPPIRDNMSTGTIRFSHPKPGSFYLSMPVTSSITYNANTHLP